MLFARALVVFAITSLPASAFAVGSTQEPVASTKAASAPTQVQGWKKVESSKVCMVTDMVFSRAQIPVEVKGTTYYGCCENCKSRLSQDAAVRKAVDPVSGKSVDKAKASIAAGPEGDVAYFENDKNLQTFIANMK